MLILVVCPAGWQGVLHAQPGAENTLPEVARIFLGKWQGKGQTQDGESFESTLKFKWTLERHFLEVENEVKSNGENMVFARTFYGWQPVLGRLVFWSFDRDGTINEGLAELAGQTLKHEWRSFGKGGEIREWRSTLELQPGPTLLFTLLDQRNTKIISIEYKKAKE